VLVDIAETLVLLQTSFLWCADLIPKPSTWKSKVYKEWLISDEQVCSMCGHEGWADNQLIVHHGISVPGMNFGKMGGKASDSAGMPLHVLCHNNFHSEFPKHKEEQTIWLLKTLMKAVQAFVQTR
jgi:hypothetical protein